MSSDRTPATTDFYPFRNIVERVIHTQQTKIMPKELAEKLVELGNTTDLIYPKKFEMHKYSGRASNEETTWGVNMSLKEAFLIVLWNSDRFVDDGNPVFVDLENIHQDSLKYSPVIY